MESSTSRSDAAQRKQDEIRAQIAALQAQLPVTPEDNIVATRNSGSSKRKKPIEPTTLAPATPSPKKRRHTQAKDVKHSKSKFPQPDFNTKPQSSTKAVLNREAEQPDRGPSKFLSKLAEVKGRPSQSPVPDTVPRSSAFSDITPRDSSTAVRQNNTGIKRDDRLALIEELERGPFEFTPPSDDPDFLQLEPHSGIRLLTRSLPHDIFQDYMTARYYLSPSQLYSIVRLQPDKQSYDVPLFGDWVTIAVVAERGPVKFSRAPVALGPDEPQDKKPGQLGKGKEKESEAKKNFGKKYVNFKLIDFGARSKSSADGGQSAIRGDAFLTLLLFEADGYDIIQTNDGQKPRKIYKGGSRGAFETMTKVKEGDVIAFLNPKILKPFQRSQDTPHPVNNVLALTPESSEAIVVIGRARDLGMCSVLKRDGKACGSWCDKRVSDVCEYHLQNAVQHRRAGRAEFTAGTSGMIANPAHKRKNNYDPSRQWGLKPEEPARESTYVLSGHVVGGSNDPRNMYIGETIGREGQAKAQRKSANAADRALKSLLERDREGMRAVMLAREASAVTSKSEQGIAPSEENVTPCDDEDPSTPGKNSFNAQVVKQLGFNPTLKAGRPKKPDDTVLLRKLQSLETVSSARKDIRLGPRPGPKIRSGVMVPAGARNPQDSRRRVSDATLDMVDLDEGSD